MKKASTSYQSYTLKELKSFANDSVLEADSRLDEFHKLAATGMDRKTVDRELKKAQKDFARARQEYEIASNELSQAQNRVQNAESKMTSSRQRMLDLNNAAQTMDLTGAEGLKQEKGGEYSYVLNGNRMHADVSDVRDIKLTPWKDYLNHIKDKAKADDSEETGEDDEEESVVDAFDEINNLLGFSDSGTDDDEELDEPELSERTEDDLDFEDESDSGDDSFDTGPYFNPYRAASVEKSVITKIAKKKFR